MFDDDDNEITTKNKTNVMGGEDIIQHQTFKVPIAVFPCCTVGHTCARDSLGLP